MNDKDSVINKIRQISNVSNSKHIRSKIINPIELESLSKFLVSEDENYSKVIDVLVQDVVSLNRVDDTWVNGDSWHDVLMRRLHGEYWEEGVFDYFENELDKVEFPAPHSRGYLQLNSYGGLIHCSNGNHRLAAGVCWLASKYGDTEASFKKVNVFVIPFNEDKLTILRELYGTCNRGIRIFRNELTNFQKDLFETNEDKTIMINSKIYTLSNKEYRLHFESKESLSDNFFRLFNFKKKKKDEEQKEQDILIDKYWDQISDDTLQKLFERK